MLVPGSSRTSAPPGPPPPDRPSIPSESVIRVGHPSPSASAAGPSWVQAPPARPRTRRRRAAGPQRCRPKRGPPRAVCPSPEPSRPNSPPPRRRAARRSAPAKRSPQRGCRGAGPGRPAGRSRRRRHEKLTGGAMCGALCREKWRAAAAPPPPTGELPPLPGCGGGWPSRHGSARADSRAPSDDSHGAADTGTIIAFQLRVSILHRARERIPPPLRPLLPSLREGGVYCEGGVLYSAEIRRNRPIGRCPPPSPPRYFLFQSRTERGIG